MSGVPHPGARTMRILRVFAAIFVVAGLIGAAEAGGSAKKTSDVLGTVGFQPTPERPVGWRGDWTGRYPGATPPLQWSRRIDGITTGLRYQAKKPNGDAAKTAQPLEYFTIKDWLV